MHRTEGGEDISIIDGHVRFRDAAKANRKNVRGAQFIDCFHACDAGPPLADCCLERRVAANVEFSGTLRRGLLAARSNEPEGGPSLLDVVHGRIPEGARPAG